MSNAVKPKEKWWTWHWDKSDAVELNPAQPTLTLPYKRITRWRRGSLLTIYRMQSDGSLQWWLYGPFNICFGFGYPKNEV